MTQGMGNSDGRNQTVDRVINFNEVREQRLEEKRRQTERIFFKNILGVYSVIAHSKIHPIEMVDVSEDGCAFQIPYDSKRIWPKDTQNIPIRLYFSQDTYIEIIVKIQNSRPFIQDGNSYVRFGCTVDKEASSYPAYQHFVRFLRLYAEHSRKDLGDVTVFYL